MEIRSLIKSFWQLANVLRVSGVQLVSVWSLSYALGQWAMISGVRGCPGVGSFISPYFWLPAIVGVAATVVAVYYILYPVIWMQSIDRQLVFGSVDVHLPFFSTQPVYVFLDAVLFVPALALLQAGRTEVICQFGFEWIFGWTFFVLTISYPLLRALSWYVLRRRIEAKKVVVPWPTLIMWWIVVVPVVCFITYSYLDNNVFPRLRVPVVNKNTFKGGLEKNPKFMAGIVRVQGVLVRDLAKCGLFGKDPEKYRFPAGTVLLDMGKKNGQIMIKASRASMVDTLEIEANGRKGKLFEAFGRLSKLPNPNKKLVCGISKADSEQKGGLALLELELPQK